MTKKSIQFHIRAVAVARLQKLKSRFSAAPAPPGNQTLKRPSSTGLRLLSGLFDVVP